MKVTRLNTGDAAVAASTEILFTSGIGSCVVICLWDFKARIGGMAHIPLPSNPGPGAHQWFASGVSPEVAFPYLLTMMKKRGANQSDMTLRLVGGGNMFSDNESPMDIGRQILAKTVEIAYALGIPMLPGCTGGRFGKSAEFNIECGTINVQHTNGVFETL